SVASRGCSASPTPPAASRMERRWRWTASQVSCAGCADTLSNAARPQGDGCACQKVHLVEFGDGGDGDGASGGPVRCGRTEPRWWFLQDRERRRTVGVANIGGSLRQ